MRKHIFTKIISRILVVLLATGLNIGVFANSASANISANSANISANFDEETVTMTPGNVIGAGTLGIDLSATSSPWIFDSSSATTTAEKTLEVVSTGSLPFQYHASTTVVAACTGIDAEFTTASGTLYAGPLDNALLPATTTIGDLTLSLTIPDSYDENDPCSFDLGFDAWQTNVSNYGDGGFTATTSTNQIVLPPDESKVVINKVYYDVDAQHGSESNEWVELYNNASTTVDLSGWRLCDNSSCDVLPEGSTITGAEYAIISATSTTWNYWNIPTDFSKIVTQDSRIGNGLGNNGDILQLEQPDETIIDTMNWGTNTGYWDPGIEINAGEGYALGRVPTGTDTDQPTDFTELAPPTVDLVSPDEDDDSLVWYWNHHYTITWNATNENGPDSDLSIDLSYVKDNNHDHMIDEGDTVYSIGHGIENNGSYDWTVPGGFVGDIWIQVTATSPENPMLTSMTTSGAIYDPFPTEEWQDDPDTVVDMIATGMADQGETISATSTSATIPNTNTPEEATTVDEEVTPPTNDGITEEVVSNEPIEGNDSTAEGTTTAPVAISTTATSTTDEIGAEESAEESATTTESVIPDIVHQTASSTDETLTGGDSQEATSTPNNIDLVNNEDAQDTGTSTPEIIDQTAQDHATASSTADIMIEGTTASSTTNDLETSASTTADEVASTGNEQSDDQEVTIAPSSDATDGSEITAPTTTIEEVVITSDDATSTPPTITIDETTVPTPQEEQSIDEGIGSAESTMSIETNVPEDNTGTANMGTSQSEQ